MPLIVVGGHAKSIGKTTLVCNIISAFPQAGWIAVKVSTHQHVPLNSELIVQSSEVAMWRQIASGDESDTARFLNVGARGAFFVQSEPSGQQAASNVLLGQISLATHVIAEATQMAEFLNPNLFLMVIGGPPSKRKSVHRLLARVDAFVRTGPKELSTDVEDVIKGKPVFEARQQGLDPALAFLISDLLRSSA